MKKLLLLNKIFFIGILVSACNPPAPASTAISEKHGDSMNHDAIDSIPRTKPMADTIKKNVGDATKGEAQSVSGELITPNKSIKKSSTEIRAIKHGSDQQMKLDSIKNAKGKLKQ